MKFFKQLYYEWVYRKVTKSILGEIKAMKNMGIVIRQERYAKNSRMYKIK